MKCYSKPKTAIDRKIDSAFEKAYRAVYMDGRSEGKQLIEDAYQAAMERKSQAWRDDSQRLSDDAASSYRRDLPAEDSDPIERAYQAHMAKLGGK
ncbi:hypothetical protein [uncultured Halomonas sp.]|uniref:hypothetical protein n=1 Tax=uncultured Halomonas sp. TaxID=173971 RepID=UPI0026356A15|nr:hypothetical protein [uncultured Halomonas sp.]